MARDTRMLVDDNVSFGGLAENLVNQIVKSLPNAAPEVIAKVVEAVAPVVSQAAGAPATDIPPATITAAANSTLAYGNTPKPTPLPNATGKETSTPLPNVNTTLPTPTPTPLVNTTTPTGIATASANTPVVTNKNIKDMTQAEIDAFTAKQIASGFASLGTGIEDKSRLIPGESFADANARISAGYQNMLAKPILSDIAKSAGATVEFVRTGAGGVGSYTVVYPAGYTGPKETTTQWTAGIIPANSPYITGTTLGVYSKGDGTYTTVDGAPITAKPTLVTNPPKGTTNTPPTSVWLIPPGSTNNPPGGTTNPPSGTTNPPGASNTGVNNVPTFTASDGKTFNNQADYITWQNKLDSDKTARQSAYDLLYSEFNKYGLGALVKPLESLITKNVSPSEFAIELQNSPAYQQRFSANKERIAKGLTALTPAQYIGLEDQYQNIMRNYGLPASYYSRDSIGTQAGFNQFIANDVSAAELEDRIQTAQKRIQYANPEVGIALKTFYPDITNGDILAYVLDPKNGLENIKRRVTAAEIGASAVAMGLTTNETDAEYLARYGITKQQAQQGYQTISGILPRASQLSDIYAQQGVNPYTQATAEREVFGTPGAAESARQRKKLVDLEQAAFSGSSGSTGGALARERAGSF